MITDYKKDKNPHLEEHVGKKVTRISIKPEGSDSYYVFLGLEDEDGLSDTVDANPEEYAYGEIEDNEDFPHSSEHPKKGFEVYIDGSYKQSIKDLDTRENEIVPLSDVYLLEARWNYVKIGPKEQ